MYIKYIKARGDKIPQKIKGLKKMSERDAC